MNSQQKIEIATLVGDITALAQLINMTTEKAVFVRIVGHVEKFEVEIRKSKESYHEHLTDDEVYLYQDKWNTPEEILEKLNRIRSELRKLLRKNNIDYSRLNYSKRIERDYHLA